MNLSWSHKLFLKINAQIGKNKIFDRVMYFCAHGLLYILGLLVMSWGAFVLVGVSEHPITFTIMAKIFITALVFAEIFSYGLALIWRHPRPIIQFPDIKLLLHPIENWKSFPSDHTIVAVILASLTIMSGVHLFFGILLIIIALLIMCGRVYVGVHYPRDIIGGIIVGLFFSFTALWLLLHVTQPLYDMLKSIAF